MTEIKSNYYLWLRNGNMYCKYTQITIPPNGHKKISFLKMRVKYDPLDIDRECKICLKSFWCYGLTHNSCPFVILSCGHYLCRNCLRSLTKNNCPFCRGDIKKKVNLNSYTELTCDCKNHKSFKKFGKIPNFYKFLATTCPFIPDRVPDRMLRGYTLTVLKDFFKDKFKDVCLGLQANLNNFFKIINMQSNHTLVNRELKYLINYFIYNELITADLGNNLYLACCELYLRLKAFSDTGAPAPALVDMTFY